MNTVIIIVDFFINFSKLSGLNGLENNIGDEQNILFSLSIYDQSTLAQFYDTGHEVRIGGEGFHDDLWELSPVFSFDTEVIVDEFDNRFSV